MWKDIIGYEDRYEISCFGEVRNKKTNKNMYKDVTNSYCKVTLTKNGKTKKHYMHRLVYLHFIGPLKEGYQINHIDYDRLNNNVSNLEQLSVFENNLHSKGRNNFKLTMELATEMRNSNLNSMKLAELYNVNSRQIRRILSNEAWYDPDYNPETRKLRIKNNTVPSN